MTSPVIKREAPQRKFENYVLTRQVSNDVGIFPISYDKFIILPGSGNADDYQSNITDLKFEFLFNNRIYDKFVVHSNGWVVLIDKAQTSFSYSDVMTSMATNQSIKSSILNNHVLLCPWFDDILGVRNYDTTSDDRIKYGIDLPSYRFNTVKHSEFGAQVAYTHAKSGDRCTVIRWNSYSYYTSPSTQIEFDVVIYESGKIEFRYSPKVTVGASNINEGATVGIFVNDGAWNFRDFSEGLGYRDNERSPYNFGGYTYDASYSEVDGVYTIPYTSKLSPANNWPGMFTSGCVFTFSPPQNRRKILPRNEIRKKDAEISYPLPFQAVKHSSQIGMFDDRNTVDFLSSKIVNFPMTLNRFYGNTSSGIVERQDLFGDLETTGSITKIAVENFVGNKPTEYIAPFNENKILEAGKEGKFYSGSKIEKFGLSLLQPLRSKTQIKFSLPLHYSTELFDVTSSIYYYNVSKKGFFVPRNTAGRDIVVDPSLYVSSISYPEDARGFGALGNVVSSGSSTNAISAGSQWQSNENIGYQTFQYKMDDQAPILTTLFEKSLQNNADYDSQAGEQFTVPVNAPFLIEKATFEIPFTMGDGWFNDRTSSGCPVTTTPPGSLASKNGVDWRVFDVGGPAITLSLFNQVRTTDNVFRDLILTGTIIPIGDNESTLKVYQTKNNQVDLYDRYIFTPEGFLSYNLSPSSVVSPNNGTEFTGSVSVPCVAGVSNGLLLSYLDSSTNSSNNSSTAQMDANRLYAKQILTSKYVPVNYGFGGSFAFSSIKDIDTFGRSQKSFGPSGRSLFGKEYVTIQGTQDPNQPGYFLNPMYVSASYDDFPTYIKNAIQTNNVGFIFNSAINLQTVEESPYLIMPGDKLTLAISKTRPRIYSMGNNPLNGSAQDYYLNGGRHNASIMTGTIHVTLFGSFLSQDTEYHPGLNQNIGSNSVHGYIGDEPVLDQYEVEYYGAHNGSYTDDYITGSMLVPEQIGNRTYLRPGDINPYYKSRGKVFSKVNAHLKGTPDTSTYEGRANGSKSFRLQPWFEKAGMQKGVTIICEEERCQDSVMPSFVECLREDGNRIISFMNAAGNFLNGTKIPDNVNNGFNFFDGYGNNENETALLYNNNWTWSYPFEPRYSKVTRVLNNFSSLTTTLSYDLSNGQAAFGKQRVIKNYFPIMISHQNNSNDFYPKIQTDINVLVPSVNTKMSDEDLSKCLFGFGDKNTITYDNSTKTKRAGNNHLPEFREWATDTVTVPIDYQVGPVIRGWKYGVACGLPLYNRCIWRRGKFGQFRDMLEQRYDTKFYKDPSKKSKSTLLSLELGIQLDDPDKNVEPYKSDSPVYVKFVDSEGSTVKPENTWSQNLSLEATSSMPYFDGETRNRGQINVPGIASTQILFGSDGGGNIFI